MKSPKGLTAIECNYTETFWHIDKEKTPYEYVSSVKEYQELRDADLYHLCGVYSKANVPHEIKTVCYEDYKQYPPYIGVMRSFSDLTYEAVSKGNLVLVNGGYCMYSPAVVGGIQRAIGCDKRIGIVWIDAHADNVVVDTTKRTSVTFNAFPLSTITGLTMQDWRTDACGLEIPCRGEDVVASDCRMINEESFATLKASNVVHIDSNGFADASVWKKAIDELSSRVDAIYLQVDADILRTEFIPAYIKNVPGGHDVDTVMRNVGIVTDTGKVCAFSIFCVDFDLYKQGGEYTYFNAMKIIAAGLQRWKYRP